MAADNKEYVTVLSTDMSKAFDSLHPALMIQKLKAYGFNEPSLNLLRSFFERRKNRVKLQEEQSAWKEQKRGCPQGSSFGPLLWNLFQNDLSIHRQSANLFMYADDHQVYTNDSDIHKATQTLRRQTEAVSQWYKENLLQANPQKYQILTPDPHSSTKTPGYALTMEFDGHEVKSSDYLKILGVAIDNKLAFSEHISDICKKTSCKVGVLLRLRNLIPWSAKLQLYKSNILPHLTYCDIVWHFCKSSDKKKVERIQERALRAVFKSKSETYNDLLTKAGLSSLYQQRLQNIATLMYKVKNRLVPTYITEIFNTTPKQYNLRNADFNIPRFRTVHYGKHSLRYFGPHLWNKLDKTDREKPNLKSFQDSIMSKNLSHLIDNCKNCDICC